MDRSDLYKKRFDPDEPRGKYQILEKLMLTPGKRTWCIHSFYKTAKERNDTLLDLLNVRNKL